MSQVTILLGILLSGASGALLAHYFLPKSKKEEKSEEAESKPDVSGEPIVLEAKARAKEIILEAKGDAIKLKGEAEKEAGRVKAQVSGIEKELTVKKAQVEAKERDLEDKARSVKRLKESLQGKEEEIENLYRKQKVELENIASLTKQEAREILLEKFDKDLEEEKAKKLKRLEEEVKRTSENKSREILLDALKYGASDYVVEYTTSKVKLPDEDLKGRIIGKEGRNIMAFEKLTGVELDLDSNAGEVLVSSFDPVRREVAKLALERLIADGRIQPARIEDIVSNAKKEVDRIIYKEGDNLCHKLGVYGLPKEVVEVLGRFKFRFSYGQNMTKHTLEVARLGTAIAHELNANVETVKLGCLLHDIGKVLSDEEGSHVDLGIDFIRKHRVSEEVIKCVAEHHEDGPYSSIESAIVALADHISGARPGARSEDYGSFVKRMKELEDAALTFDGVEKAYAISAGREVRVFVRPDQVDDTSTALLAREVARKIELEQTYPGVVKVTVIRETRVSETAK